MKALVFYKGDWVLICSKLFLDDLQTLNLNIQLLVYFLNIYFCDLPGCVTVCILPQSHFIALMCVCECVIHDSAVSK